MSPKRRTKQSRRPKQPLFYHNDCAEDVEYHVQVIKDILNLGYKRHSTWLYISSIDRPVDNIVFNIQGSGCKLFFFCFPIETATIHTKSFESNIFELNSENYESVRKTILKFASDQLETYKRNLILERKKNAEMDFIV